MPTTEELLKTYKSIDDDEDDMDLEEEEEEEGDGEEGSGENDAQLREQRKAFMEAFEAWPIQERRSVVEDSLLDADAGGHRGHHLPLVRQRRANGPSGWSECVAREALAK